MRKSRFGKTRWLRNWHLTCLTWDSICNLWRGGVVAEFRVGTYRRSPSRFLPSSSRCRGLSRGRWPSLLPALAPFTSPAQGLRLRPPERPHHLVHFVPLSPLLGSHTCASLEDSAPVSSKSTHVEYDTNGRAASLGASHGLAASSRCVPPVPGAGGRCHALQRRLQSRRLSLFGSRVSRLRRGADGGG